ncbi:MAG: hypothetical protein ACFE8A_05375 [Candidatus Hodarchaeota archaeon]
MDLKPIIRNELFTAGPIGGPPEALGVIFEVKVYYTLPPVTRAFTTTFPFLLIAIKLLS